MIDKRGLSDILSFVTPDAEAISDTLFREYGSAERILSEDCESIERVTGKSDVAVFLKLATSLAKRRITDAFKFGVAHTNEEIEDYLFALFLCESEEKIYALTLDAAGRVTKCALVGSGDAGYATLLPRKIISLCERDGASTVILAHNHPGGVAAPSEEDVRATKHTRELLESVNVNLYLHYIYAGHNKCTVPV